MYVTMLVCVLVALVWHDDLTHKKEKRGGRQRLGRVECFCYCLILILSQSTMPSLSYSAVILMAVFPEIWSFLNTSRSLISIPRSLPPASTVTMMDRSSANIFEVGEIVRVVDDVEKSGVNLKGREGYVKETWEKCDVDPTCCCAEFVDDGFAVHVEFQADEKFGDASITQKETFVHYFAERELVHRREDEDPEETVAFDGMSCKAFKLDQLKMGEQARRIATFQEARANEQQEQ